MPPPSDSRTMDAREAARVTDQYFHASQARAFASLSPASLSLAWLDWAMHLAASPGKQTELLRLAASHQGDLARYLYDCLRASGDPSPVCIAHEGMVNLVVRNGSAVPSRIPRVVGDAIA